MVRHVIDRKAHIQTEQPRANAAAPQSQPPAAAPPNPVLHFGWQVALFVWLASFVFLFVNDLLTCVFKLVSRGVG